MTLLDLETFAPNGADDSDGHVTKPVATYDEGFAAGDAAARAELAQQQGQLTDELVAAVLDCVAGHRDAQHSLLTALQPLLSAMLDTLLPAVLAPALHAQLHALITDALAKDLDAPIKLTLSPQMAESLAATFGDTSPDLTVTRDPTHGPHEARLTVGREETSLDLDRAHAAIVAHVAALQDLSTPSEVTL